MKRLVNASSISAGPDFIVVPARKGELYACSWWHRFLLPAGNSVQRNSHLNPEEDYPMKKSARFSTWVCLVFCGAGVVAAQEPATPPKVLVIQREFVKPGKSGSLHVKSESAFVQAFAGANWPTHYFAAESMSGRPRVLFFVGYPSFEAWEKDNQATDKNAAFSAALDRASIADGELLTEYAQSVFAYDPDHSLRTGSIVHSRYFEISQIRIKPGHRAEWMELMKMYRDGFEKAVPNANWAVYESYYGQDNGGIYLLISRMTSLSEDDQGITDDKKFADAMGEDGMKKVRGLTAACVESTQTNLFQFNPKMSYPPEEWIKADPFWKPKAAEVAAASATP
jgi:hypothetical protein